MTESNKTRARAWYAEEMAEQPADCACYELHIASLVRLLSAAEERGATLMRERADAACEAVAIVDDGHGDAAWWLNEARSRIRALPSDPT